jgi:hypothetical protein
MLLRRRSTHRGGCHGFIHSALQQLLQQDWRTLLRARAQNVYKFEETLLCAHGNFKEQNNVLESSIIIINYCIIIIIVINAFYSYSYNCIIRT